MIHLSYLIIQAVRMYYVGCAFPSTLRGAPKYANLLPKPLNKSPAGTTLVSLGQA